MVETWFEDTVSRRIHFQRTATELVIEYRGQRIGHLAVEAVSLPAQPGKSARGFRLTEVFLEPAFRRAGIGSAALACSRDWYEPLDIPRDEATLANASPDYRGLLARALRQGQFLHPWPKEVAHRGRRSDLDR